MTGERRGGLQGAPGVLVLVAVGAGLAVVSLVDWRLGLYLVGTALLVAAGLRSSLPERSAGLLVVRSRGLDAAVLLVLGTGVLLLANTVPVP